MPYFSIVIPLYNKEAYIKKALDSILQQSFEDFEVIVVDNDSDDDSLNIAKSFTDQRIKVFSITNNGPSSARNFGVSKASSDLIVLLDADDHWEPNHLADLKSLYEAFPDCGLYAKAYKLSTNNTLIKGIYKNIPEDWKGVLSDYFQASMGNGIASCSSVMLPKSILGELNGFNTNFNAGEDTDLWIRIALKHPVAFHNTASAIINWDADNRLSNINIKNKKHFSLNAYSDQELENKSLKQYMDLNRLSLAFQYKMAGFSNDSKELARAIDRDHITKTQRFLLGMPSWLLKLLLKIRNFLRGMNLDLRLFK